MTNCESESPMNWSIYVILISGDGGEKQGIWYGNPFQRHIQGIQQGQWR